ncbi:MAG: oligosaccharide flippase family protein [Chloroflexi bacterium]|nr:oligosaccharide flippase family protein [Chloroflexota bacterium]
MGVEASAPLALSAGLVVPPPTEKTLNLVDVQRAARNAGALTLASIIGKGGVFLWQLVLIAQLGERLYGIYSVVASSMALAAAFSALGMGVILTRDVARAPRRAGEYWSAALLLQTALSALAYPAILLAAGWGEGELAGQARELQGYLALVGINLFLDCTGNIGNDLLVAQERLRQTALVSVLHIIALIGLGGIALWLGYGLWGVYVGSIVASSLRALAMNACVWRSGVRPRRFAPPLARGLFFNAAPIGLNALLALGITQLDKQITARFLGVESAGHLFAAAMLVMGCIELLGTPQLTALLPLHAKLQGDPRAAQIPERISYFMLLWTLPLALGICFFAPTLVEWLFQAKGFEQSGPILAILIWTVPLIITSDMFAQAMMMQNRQRRLLWIRGMGLALNIGLNVAVLLQWGDVRGVALASVGAECFVLLMLANQLRQYGIHWRQLGRRIARLMLVLAGAALLIGFLRGYEANLSLALALVGYGLALWRGGLLSEWDRELLGILWRMLPFTADQAPATR